MANCMNCGAPIEEGAVFCRNCGAKLAVEPMAAPVAAPVEAAPAAAPEMAPAAAPVDAAPAPEMAPAMEAPVQEAPVMAPMDGIAGAATFASGTMQPNMAGAPMQGAPMTGMPVEPKEKKPFPVKLVAIIAAVLVIAIVVVVILLTRRTEVSINSFVSVEYSGYDTLGTAEIVFDSDAFEEKYGDKIKYKSGKDDEYLDAIDFLEDVLEDSATLENDSDLSNGDVVTFTWDIDKEYVEETLKIKLKYSDMEFTVEGLTELATYDPFANVDVTFEGYDTQGSVYINFTYGDELMNHLWYDCDKYYDLANGDEITITLYLSSWTYDTIDDLCISNGYKPIELTKTYKVEGLTELVEIDIFEDVVVTFTGVNGDGYANIATNSDNHVITELNFQLDKDYGLSNGDTVVASAWTWWYDVDEYLMQYGYIPKELEKTYTVSGLGSYVESVDQFPADFLTTIDAAGRVLYAEDEVQFWSDVISMNNMELVDAYFMTYNYDDYWYNVGKNCLALIYKNTVDVNTYDGEAQAEYYTTVVFQDALILEDGSITVDEENSYVDYGYHMFSVGYEYFGVNGFETYEDAYDDFVGYYADSYTVTALPISEEEVVEPAEPEYVDEDGDGIDDVTGETIPTEEETGEAYLTFDLPEGFVEDGDGMYKHESGDYLSNINVMTVENDGSFYTFTEEAVYDEIETALKEQMGEDVEITMDEFENITIGEYDAIAYAISYEYLGYGITQAQVVVDDPDEFIYITYTLFDEEDLGEAFEESLASIRYEVE